MSTIGELERSSTIPQRRKNSAATTISPSRRGDVQPQDSPSVSATISESRPPESSRAPGMSTRDGEPDRRLGHETVHERDRESDGDRAEQEEQAPREVVDDHAREDDPEAAADAEHGREQADPDLDLLGRELVADDREAEREERAAGARDDAECDQRPDAPRERCSKAAGEEEPEADEQHPLLPELVAQLAEDRGRHRSGDEESGQHPRRPGGARAELLLERPERREDHRLLQRERGAGERQDPEGDVVVLAVRVGVPRRGQAACT